MEKDNSILGPFLIFVVLVLVAGSAYASYRKDHVTKEPIRECPEQWLVEKPPTVAEDKRVLKQYYIYKGKKMDAGEFDVVWIDRNCGLDPEAIL